MTRIIYIIKNHRYSALNVSSLFFRTVALAVQRKYFNVFYKSLMFGVVILIRKTNAMCCFDISQVMPLYKRKTFF